MGRSKRAPASAPLLRASELRALRRLIRAAGPGYPFAGHRSLAEVWGPQGGGMAEPAQPVPDAVAEKRAGKEPRAAAAIRSQAKTGGETQGGRTCEPCAEPVSRPVTGRSVTATSEPMDVTAGETAPVPFVPRQRIDLGGVKSEMDRRAEAIEAARVRDVQAALAARFAGETAVCRCGGTGVGTLGPVPAWFGRDCIEGDCPLKGNGRG